MLWIETKVLETKLETYFSHSTFCGTGYSIHKGKIPYLLEDAE